MYVRNKVLHYIRTLVQEANEKSETFEDTFDLARRCLFKPLIVEIEKKK